MADFDSDRAIKGDGLVSDDSCIVREKRKRRQSIERDDGVEIAAAGHDGHPPMMPAAKKKARFVWTPQHHRHFVDAVTQLGNKAVPRRIVELMNMPGLTREHVASHLQKYRVQKEKESKEATEEHNGNGNGRVEANNADGSRHVSLSPQPQAENCNSNSNCNNDHSNNNKM